MSYDPLQDSDADWGEPIEAEVPPGGPSVVMSVRMSQELANQLRNEARRRGIATSTLIRETLAAGMQWPHVARLEQAPQVSSPNAGVTFTMGVVPDQRTVAAPVIVRWVRNADRPAPQGEERAG